MCFGIQTDFHASESHLKNQHAHEDHGPDEHGFFFTESEMSQSHDETGHHELDKNHKPHEVSPSMWIPLVVLAVLSVGGGFLLEQHETFRDWLYPEGKLTVLSPEILHGHPEHIPLMALSLGAAGLGILLGAIVYFKGLPKKEGWDESKWSPFRRAAARQFGYDDTVVNMGIQGGNEVATGLWKGFDKFVIDRLVNGAGWFASALGRLGSKMQTGAVRAYALTMLAGGVGFLGYFLYLLQKGGK